MKKIYVFGSFSRKKIFMRKPCSQQARSLYILRFKWVNSFALFGILSRIVQYWVKKNGKYLQFVRSLFPRSRSGVCFWLQPAKYFLLYTLLFFWPIFLWCTSDYRFKKLTLRILLNDLKIQFGWKSVCFLTKSLFTVIQKNTNCWKCKPVIVRKHSKY